MAMLMRSTNGKRVDIAGALFDLYAAWVGRPTAPHSDEEVIVGLVADLCHLSKSLDVDPSKALKTALMHFSEEYEQFGPYGITGVRELRFQTSDGYALVWTGHVWSDGDMEFGGDLSGPVESGTGERIPGTLSVDVGDYSDSDGPQEGDER
tara:strand:- start:3330 stop:3782 length:453 start_codon:yes stop_codon:yes gene_type:complete